MKLGNGTTYFGKLIMKKTLRIYFKSILHFHRTYDLSSIKVTILCFTTEPLAILDKPNLPFAG